jgi:hypothetical protein
MSTKDDFLSQRRLPLVSLLSGVGLLVMGWSIRRISSDLCTGRLRATTREVHSEKEPLP